MRIRIHRPFRPRIPHIVLTSVRGTTASAQTYLTDLLTLIRLQANAPQRTVSMYKGCRVVYAWGAMPPRTPTHPSIAIEISPTTQLHGVRPDPMRPGRLQSMRSTPCTPICPFFFFQLRDWGSTQGPERAKISPLESHNYSNWG